MDFRLTDEQAFIQETIRKFIANECPREVARTLDEGRQFPRELLDQLADIGFCGLNVPEEYGGGGRSLLGSIIVVEELSTVCPALAGAFAGIALRGGAVISELGSDQQKRDWLPGIAGGSLLFSYAVTEPSGGESGAIPITASRNGHGFTLAGTARHVSLAGRADYLLTLAGTREGLSFFVVDANASGMQVVEVEQVGFHGIGLHEVVFDGVPVSADAILGGAEWLHRGSEQTRHIRAMDHLETAAYGLGIARGAYDYALDYARERVQFGQPIVRFEAIQHMLVGIATEIRAVGLLLYQAGWFADQGRPYALEAAMARVHATEVARRAALQGLHILGGYGYTMEYDAQRYVRDSLALLDGAETSELVKISIGEMLGLGKAWAR